MALSVLGPNLTSHNNDNEENSKDTSNQALNMNKVLFFIIIFKNELDLFINLYDLKRLESYTKNLVDYHMIMDLIPTLGKLFFSKQLGNMTMSYSQAAILLALSLQYKKVEDVQVLINNVKFYREN